MYLLYPLVVEKTDPKTGTKQRGTRVPVPMSTMDNTPAPPVFKSSATPLQRCFYPPNKTFSDSSRRDLSHAIPSGTDTRLAVAYFGLKTTSAPMGVEYTMDCGVLTRCRSPSCVWRFQSVGTSLGRMLRLVSQSLFPLLPRKTATTATSLAAWRTEKNIIIFAKTCVSFSAPFR